MEVEQRFENLAGTVNNEKRGFIVPRMSCFYLIPDFLSLKLSN